MSDRAADDGGIVPDEQDLDITEGASPTGPAGAGPLEGEGPPPGHPGSSLPSGSPGEAASRAGASPAGPTSPTTGTGTSPGADRDAEDVPPTAPG